MLQNFRLGKSISQLIWHKVEDENPASSWSSAPLRLVVLFNIRHSLVLNLLPHSYFPPSCETLSHSSQLPSISFFLPSSSTQLSPSLHPECIFMVVSQTNGAVITIQLRICNLDNFQVVDSLGVVG